MTTLALEVQLFYYNEHTCVLAVKVKLNVANMDPFILHMLDARDV